MINALNILDTIRNPAFLPTGIKAVYHELQEEPAVIIKTITSYRVVLKGLAFYIRQGVPVRVPVSVYRCIPVKLVDMVEKTFYK